MPAPRSSRQPTRRAQATLAGERLRALLRDCRRDAAAEIAHCSGRYGLFVHPRDAEGGAFPAPNLHTRLRLHDGDDGFDGDLRCEETSLPLMDGSLALVFADCVFESVRDPVGFAAECARVLEPEGMLFVLGLNPWSASRLRWMFGGLRAWSPGALRALLTGLGLEFVGCRYLGGHWSHEAAGLDIGGKRRSGSPLHGGYLLQARRRVTGITPLRAKPAKLRIGAGANAGPARMRVRR